MVLITHAACDILCVLFMEFLKVRIIHVTQDQWAENTYHKSQNSYTRSLQTEKNENKLLV